MKKNLLTLMILSGTFANAQILTYVGDQTTVTVTDQALIYNGGGWQNAGTSVVDNAGDIMVVGSISDNFDIASTSNFNLKYISSSVYGQLYIKGLLQTGIVGKVNKEYKADGNSGSTGAQQISLPFYNFSSADIKTTLGNWLNTTVSSLTNAGRFNNASLFKWNNKAARFDQITDANSSSGVGKPTDYIILPRRDAAGTVQWDAANDLKIFRGTPVSDSVNLTQNIPLEVSNIPSYGINGSSKNYYSERYNSYLDDPFALGGGVATNWSTQYAKRLSQFANPFLTNMDLFNIARGNTDADGDGNVLTNVEGIAYYGANDINYTPGVGTIYTTGSLTMLKTAGGYFQAGDIDRDKLLIKPLQEVMIKFLDDIPVSLNFNKTRRLAQNVRDGAGYTVTGKGMSDIAPDQIVKQVAAVLYNSSGEELGRTYYAVSPSATTGFSENAKLQGYVENYAIFTKEESVNGGEDSSQPYQLYINEANEINFQGKKLPLGINYTNPSTLKFEVYEGGKRVAAGGNLSNGKSFYIAKDNLITKINDGYTMPVASLSYGLYYDQPLGVLGVNDSLKDQTVIAKKDNGWVVKFANDWKSAKVEVFSAAGQLLNTSNKVSTTSDYLIPINNTSGLYLVKATSDKGEVVIKKIVK